jgi:hypothetical protein
MEGSAPGRRDEGEARLELVALPASMKGDADEVTLAAPCAVSVRPPMTPSQAQRVQKAWSIARLIGIRYVSLPDAGADMKIWLP